MSTPVGRSASGLRCLGMTGLQTEGVVLGDFLGILALGVVR